jgi:ERF superfamily
MTEPMPKEIATAIVTVMKTTGRITKAGRNTQGGFSYASVDSFLELVNPACSEAGLIIMPIELSSELEHIEVADKAGGTKQRRFARIKFGFVLIHESGATWTNERDTRTILVDHTGAQCFGAAQSYVLKQYMRSLFQIATGDKDADASEQFEAELVRAKVKAIKAKNDGGGEQILIKFGDELEPIAATDVTARVMDKLMEIGDPEDAGKWWDDNMTGRQQLHNQFPKIAMELKRRVEAFVKPSQGVQ